MRKWRCIKSNNKKCFTVGKIYSTDDNGYGLVGDNGEDGWCPIWQMCENAEFEEITSFTQSDLKPCMFVKLRGSEEWCIIIQAKDGLPTLDDTGGRRVDHQPDGQAGIAGFIG